MCFLCQSLDPTITEYDAHGLGSNTPADDPAGASSATKPIYTLDQVAYQLTNGYWESNGGEWRAFDVQAGGTLTVNIDGLDPTGQAAAMTALAAWTAASGLQFQITSGSADITFDDEDSGAYAWSSIYVGWNQIAASHVNVDSAWQQYGDYYTQTFIHEIGHALGLGHGGNYNGSADFDSQALYANDSWQMSVMSYFSQWENDNVDASYNFLATASMADILAIQILYGTPDNVNTGATTYGDNTNLTQLGMDLTRDWAVTIFDSSGTDLIDLGTRSYDQRLDLNAETWSDLNGEIGNFGIARGAVIENARTGSGDDEVTGNAANNDIQTGAGTDTLQGGAGDDTLTGGAGDDTAVFEGAMTDFDVLWDGALGITDTDHSDGDEGTDQLVGIETLRFSGGDYGKVQIGANTTTVQFVNAQTLQTVRMATLDTSQSYSWTSITKTWDADGNLDTQINTYDDGRVLEIDYAGGALSVLSETDAANAFTWTSILKTWDSSGQIDAQTNTYDNGRVAVIDYTDGALNALTETDSANIFSWATITKTWDADGNLDTQTNTYDDGRVLEIDYVGGALSSLIETDEADAFVWTTIAKTWDAEGRLDTQTNTYDDGRVLEIDYEGGALSALTETDVADAFDWTTMSKTWGTDGRLDTQTTAYDDGRVLEIDYDSGVRSSSVLTDTSDIHGWHSQTDSYDAEGTLVERVILWDDGTQQSTVYGDTPVA